MIELEKTYLAKYIPVGLQASESKKIVDLYLPQESVHPSVRIRQQGDRYEITKKTPIQGDDFSKQLEQTIVLSKEEFHIFSQLPAKRVSKIRYYYLYEGMSYEVDVFDEVLHGLVLVDVEFSSEKEKEAFVMPDFCLVEVTQEKYIAGGMLCGKQYSDINDNLNRFSYTPLFF